MIRMGVVGVGGRGASLIKNVFRVVEPELRVVGVVDPDEKGARSRLAECDREAVFYKDLATMVRKAKLDCLMISTRCHLHTPYAAEAAKYDIPLYLEKPVAVNMRQARHLERAFESSRCPVVVSFPLRVSPLCVQARQLIADGAVGQVEHIAATNYVSYGTVYFDHPGYRKYEITQGLFLQKATHDLDYLMYLADQPIVRVAAMANWGRVFGGSMKPGLTCSQCKKRLTCPESPRNRERNHSGGTLEDHPCTFGKDIGTPEEGMNEDCSSALIEFADGSHGVYTQVFFTRRNAERRGAVVSGYEGTVEFDWYRNELRRIRHHEPFTDVTQAAEGLSHFGGDIELAHDFFDILAGHGKSRTPVETGLASVYACLAAKESSHKGRFVDVRQVGQGS